MLHSHKRSSLALALLAATMLTPPDLARAAPGDALGLEFQVNTVTANEQSASAIATDTDGDFVVVWHSSQQDGASFGVFAQRFDEAGSALGDEFQVNTTINGFQGDPAVAMDADGDFVVAWQDSGEDGSSAGIFAQRFDAAGVSQGSEFQVNTFTTGNQFSPIIAMDADGDFVVAWQSRDQDGSSDGVYAQRYDAAGAAQGDEFRVNSITTGSQRLPAVAMDADGDFVVAWSSYGQVGSDWGIFAQRYDAAGTAQGPEIQVNSITTKGQAFPAVAMDADGDFVVAWQADRGDGVYVDYDIVAQRFDDTGTAQGPEILVNSFTNWSQNVPAVAMDADGDLIVVWHSTAPDPSHLDVFAQRFDAAGAAQGSEFQVHTFTTNNQWFPAVAMDADGDFVIAWESEGQDGSNDGIFAQRYQGAGPVPNDFTVDGRSDVLWRHNAGTTSLWQMDGFTKEDTGSVGAPSTDWQVRGLADFNADTKTDVLWRHTINGSAVIWLMDGFDKLASGGIGAPSAAWQIVSVGDFDGNDHADILWRNVTNGAALIWLMDGLKKTASGGIGKPPLVWEVAGVGDFDADAKADILWRNTTSGAAAVWLMDGFTKDSSGGIGAPSTDWLVEGLGTFNSDARSDILWRHNVSGSTVIWQMNGLAKEDAAGIGAPPTVWRIEGVGDTDGDRQSDIIWRNTGTDNTLVWKMDGFSKEAVGGIGSVPLVWEVQ